MTTDVKEVLERYRQNFPVFEQEMERLENDHLGQFAVIANGKVIDVCTTEEQARATDAPNDSVIFKIGHNRFRFAMLTA